MNPTSNKNGSTPTGVEQKLLLALTGTTNVIPQGSSIVMGHVQLTQAQLIQKLNALIAPFQTVRDDRTALAKDLLARKATVAEAHVFLGEYKAALQGLFGTGNPELGKFGFAPKKKVLKLNSEQRMVATAKLRRTRALRHTLGARQKAQLTADGSLVVTVGPKAEVPPAPTPGGAVSPSSGSASGSGSSGSGK